MRPAAKDSTLVQASGVRKNETGRQAKHARTEHSRITTATFVSRQQVAPRELRVAFLWNAMYERQKHEEGANSSRRIRAAFHLYLPLPLDASRIDKALSTHESSGGG